MEMRSFKEMRQDPHCPSNMDPADYVMVGEFDAGSGYKWVRHNVLRRFGIETGTDNQYSFDGVPFFDAETDADPPRPNYRCHHCGKHGSNIRYFVLFLHKPTSQVIVVGQICAKKLELESRDELDRLQHRRDEYERRQAQSKWRDAHPDEVAYLREYDEQHAAGGWYSEFFESLWDKLQRYGNLSEGQLSGLQRWMANGKPWVRQAKPEPTIDADRHKGHVTHDEDEPTAAQLAFIAKLAEELDSPYDMPETRREASDLINTMKAAKQMVQEVGAPKMTDNQRTYINALMESRVIPAEQRRKVRAEIDAGLTRERASACIKWLQSLERIEESC